MISEAVHNIFLWRNKKKYYADIPFYLELCRIQRKKKQITNKNILGTGKRWSLFVLKLYGPVNPVGSIERGQFT